MSRILIPGASPLAERAIERAVRDARKLPEFADAASLPLPERHTRELVFVTDILMVAVSTGSAWLRLDTGATL